MLCNKHLSNTLIENALTQFDSDQLDIVQTREEVGGLSGFDVERKQGNGGY